MRNYLSKSSFGYVTLSVIVTIIFIVAACTTSSSGFKPRPLGAPGELLLVIDNANWSSKVGKTLGNMLEDAFPALPQEETMFRKTRIDYSQFKRHFRTYRNILLISVRNDTDVNKVEYRKNEWALNQQVAEVIAKDRAGLVELLLQKWPTIKSFFYGGDINSLVQSYNRVYEPQAVDAITCNYPFSMYFPKGFQLKKQSNEFTWLSIDRLESHLGVFVYSCSLDSLKGTENIDLLRLRNKLLHREVPGENPGSFMTTEEAFPVLVNKCTFGGKEWVELRGLWKVQGDFMGGPFVDYFYIDKQNNKLLMLEGYVYAPSKPKKSIYVREVEAVLKSYKGV